MIIWGNRYNVWKKRFAFLPTYLSETKVFVWWEYYEERLIDPDGMFVICQTRKLDREKA